MTANEARGCVTEARRALDRAMRALSVPGPDWGRAARAARECERACHALHSVCWLETIRRETWDE